MTLEFRVGDVFERLAEIPDGSIDLVVTSPPFLALRSYLPADHPDKHREIGSEATPADFLETLLALTAEFGRVLAPHGSICVELGDTFSGSGGAGGDYAPADPSNGTWAMRAGQPKFEGSAAKARRYPAGRAAQDRNHHLGGSGWPLPKSLTGIPTLYAWSLAYARNLLTGRESSAGRWRIRNVIVWARPNPPVGALADKFRPGTSYVTVACRGERRYFDLDAVRTEAIDQRHRTTNGPKQGDPTYVQTANYTTRVPSNVAGAPPLDWHDDMPEIEDGDWLWRLSTQSYKGSHYATFPTELPRRLIEAMCPRRVCAECGRPSERITERTAQYAAARAAVGDFKLDQTRARGINGTTQYHNGQHIDRAEVVTVGWTHCDCGAGCRSTAWRTDVIAVEQVELNGRWVDVDAVDDPTGLPTRTKRKRRRVLADVGECVDPTHWRTGVVLDPFVGSGTTLAAAQMVGRDGIGVDLDERNATLARERVGMFLETVGADEPPKMAPEQLGLLDFGEVAG